MKVKAPSDIVEFFKEHGFPYARDHLKNNTYYIAQYRAFMGDALQAGRLDIFKEIEPYFILSSSLCAEIIDSSIQDNHSEIFNYMMNEYLVSGKCKARISTLFWAFDTWGWDGFHKIYPFTFKSREPEELMYLVAITDLFDRENNYDYLKKLCNLDRFLDVLEKAGGDHQGRATKIQAYFSQKEQQLLQKFVPHVRLLKNSNRL